MFSTTTIASSMTRPMAIARPPIDMRLIVPPLSCRMKNVPRSSAAGCRGDECCPPVAQEDSSTKTASTPPIMIASLTLRTASRTNVGEVVDLGDAHRGRQRPRLFPQRLLHALGDLEDVAADLPRNVDDGGRFAVAADERRPVERRLRALRRRRTRRSASGCETQ